MHLKRHMCKGNAHVNRKVIARIFAIDIKKSRNDDNFIGDTTTITIFVLSTVLSLYRDILAVFRFGGGE